VLKPPASRAERQGEASMKHSLLVLAAALTVAMTSSAFANAAVAPFGCDARAPDICYFRIFYVASKETRDVILPAGMKQKIPGVEIGRDTYCLGISARPAYRCAKRVINGTYNH
jgi:hypothetical protein